MVKNAKVREEEEATTVCHVASPRRYFDVSFGGVGIAPECVASPTGKSVLAAMLNAPVVFVDFKIPVVNALVPAE